MIGQDFPKIQWDIFDLQLLEPNAMFGDIVLFAMSLFFAAQIRKMNKTQPFFHYWRLFFVWFGWSFILGGCGHLFYNYTGLWGKYPSWILGMVSTFYLTKAMISLWSDPKQKTWFTHSALALLILGILTECMVFVKVDLTTDQRLVCTDACERYRPDFFIGVFGFLLPIEIRVFLQELLDIRAHSTA